MNERRSLVEGVKSTPPVDPKVEAKFVFQEKAKLPEGQGRGTPAAAPVSRSPISTRIRSDYAVALKRASLERQLEGVTPHSLQDILEEAIGPWLKSNGYHP
jgi:hypothetical protein